MKHKWIWFLLLLLCRLLAPKFNTLEDIDTHEDDEVPDDERVCRECGEVFDVKAAEWAYNDYWNDQHEDYIYGLEYPEMDICDECAIEDTERRYF